MDREEVDEVKRIFEDLLAPALIAHEGRVMASVAISIDGIRTEVGHEQVETRTRLQNLDAKVSNVDAGNVYIIKRLDSQDTVLTRMEAKIDHSTEMVNEGRVENGRRDGKEETKRNVVKGIFGAAGLSGIGAAVRWIWQHWFR